MKVWEGMESCRAPKRRTLVFYRVPGTSADPPSAALVSWASQEELDMDSSNEEDPDGTAEGDPPSNSGPNAK